MLPLQVLHAGHLQADLDALLAVFKELQWELLKYIAYDLVLVGTQCMMHPLVTFNMYSHNRSLPPNNTLAQYLLLFIFSLGSGRLRQAQLHRAPGPPHGCGVRTPCQGQGAPTEAVCGCGGVWVWREGAQAPWQEDNAYGYVPLANPKNSRKAGPIKKKTVGVGGVGGRGTCICL